ncbi:hypothetical protein ACFLT9_11830 [Acidobacteriota bacterium]
MADYNANKEFRIYLTNELFPQLKSAFESGDTNLMGDLLGGYTIVAHPDGKISQGRGKISSYFKEQRAITPMIEFDVISIYTREVSNPGPDQADLLHIGHAIIGFTGSRGSMTITRCHPRVCVWGDCSG